MNKLINSTHLPGIPGVGVKEDKELVGRCVLLIIGYAVIDFVSI